MLKGVALVLIIQILFLNNSNAQENKNPIKTDLEPDITLDFAQEADSVEPITPKLDKKITFLVKNVQPEQFSKVLNYKFFKNGSKNPIEDLQPEANQERNSIKYTFTAGDLDSIYPIILRWKDETGKTRATITLNEYNEGGEKTTSKSAPTNEDYIVAIKENFKGFTENAIYRQDNTIYLFLYEDLKVLPGTVFPDCNEKDYVYIVNYITTNLEDKVTFKGRENKVGSDLVIGSTQAAAEKDSLYVKQSPPLGPFQLGIDIEVTVEGKYSKTYTISSCSLPYHVSIMGGFFASSLSNPTRITAGTNRNGEPTLFADNANSQKVISLMAVFYPKPRDPYYSYKELNYWEKWSLSFGTKVSEDIFDDFFLGLNYEFAKAGNFTAGVHYGEHTVIQGYDDFRFGKDIYNGTFTNANTNLKYDFGFFIGLSIDLRVIGALRNNARDQARQNQNPNPNPNPTPNQLSAQNKTPPSSED